MNDSTAQDLAKFASAISTPANEPPINMEHCDANKTYTSATETTVMPLQRFHWRRKAYNCRRFGDDHNGNQKMSGIRPHSTCRRFKWTAFIVAVITVFYPLLMPSVYAVQRASIVRLNHPNDIIHGTADHRSKRSVYSIQYFYEEDAPEAAAAAAKPAEKKKQPVATAAAKAKPADEESFDVDASFDTKTSPNRPEVGQKTAIAGATIVDSRAQLAKQLPKNVEGMSTLNAVDVPRLIKAREMKLTTLFGPTNSDVSSMKALLPKEFDDPSAEGGRIAYALLIEMTAKYYRKFRSNSPVERAKALTMNMIDKGRPIHCHVGMDLFEKTVECISTAGVIDSCVKTVGKTGQTYRGCGLAGHRERGCHNTPSGRVCFCHSDLCNSGIRTQLLPGNVLFLLAISAITTSALVFGIPRRLFGVNNLL